ncbi:SGNH/GDSL hydrolase family protein [bacterium]|nr:SGNH/GDSL hydrolase family protein [bacterium]
MKKIILINIVILYFLLSVIIIFSPLLIDLKKSMISRSFNDKRFELPNYENISWAKKHFFEYIKLNTKYYDHITWRRNDFNGETITIKNGYRMNNTNENFTLNKDIWVFGGSTVWGTGTNDKNTIPSLIEKLTNISTLNLGETGYNTTQDLNLLLKELVKHKPKKIIFYAGVNDVGKCKKNLNYFSTIQETIIQNDLQSKSNASYSKKLIIAPVKILEKLKKFFPKNQNTKSAYDCDINVSKAEKIAKTFVNNWINVELIAKKNNIKFIPILQPTIFTSTSNKDYLSTNYELKKQYEILYELIKIELSKEDFKYLNFESSLNKAENYFIDFCHLSPNGNMKIAREIITSDFF